MQFHPPFTCIAGRYEVAGRPIVGGMGIVYLCEDLEERRPVALKTFQPHFLPDRAARERFLEECTTWVCLGKHPHIVRCHQVFQDSPRPEVYLVLELVAMEEGRRDASLRSWLRPGKPSPVDQALLIALQIVRGMRHATETISGFVHRDLKPENVLMGADWLSNAPINRVRVTDFGLVRGLRTEQIPAAVDADLAQGLSRLTRIGSVVGTPHYMAPEQWEGSDVAVQADIYAVGCMLGEMLTCRMLVQGGTLDEVRRAHQDGRAMRAMRSVSGAVQELLAGCLAVKLGERYQDWAPLEEALAATYGHLTDRPVPEGETGGALSRAERVAAGWSYEAMGASYLMIGKADIALSFFKRASQTGQIENEHRLEAAGLNSQGLAYSRMGDARRAIALHEQALTILQGVCRASDERSADLVASRDAEAAALGNLGRAYFQLGDAHRTISYHEQALAIHKQVGDRYSEGADLSGLAISYRHLGSIQKAIDLLYHSLSIFREFGDRLNEGTTLQNLGSVYRQVGDIRQAAKCYEQALICARKVGDRQGEADVLGNLGLVNARLGDTHQAIYFLEQALLINRETGNRRGEGTDLGDLGEAYRQLGDAQRAILCLWQAVMIHREVGDRRGESTDLGNLGNAYLFSGEVLKALDFYEQALELSREIGNMNGVASWSFNMAAALYAQHGDPAKTLHLAKEAARLWNQMGNTAHAQRAQELAAQLERRGK